MLWVLWFAFLTPAWADAVLRPVGSHWAVEGITINGKGPYRFLLDTGAQSTVVDPALADSLGLRPSYRVEVVSVNGSHLAPAVERAELTVDGQTVTGEVLIYPIEGVRQLDPSLAGILGQSALAGLAYEIDSRSRRLRIGGSRPEGYHAKLSTTHGRPCIEVDGLRLVLDSGAESLILFRDRFTGVRVSGQVNIVNSLGKSETARAGSLREWRLGDLRLRNVPVVLHPNGRAEVDGLLPVRLFSAVYIDPAGVVTLRD